MDDMKNRLAEMLRSGEKTTGQFKTGVEIEHFVVDKSTWNSVDFYQENGVETILKILQPFGYKAKYENDYLVGLDREDAIITTEPGGQLEISIKPCFSIREIELIYEKFLQEIMPILEEHGQYLLALGYHPKSRINDIPLIPKKKYQIMEAYLSPKGQYARNMMKGTAALQVSIDYRDESDFAKKMRIANFIAPLLAIASDNLPIFEGASYPEHSLRSQIWQHTDPSRCGTIPGVLDKSFGYLAYAGYILNTEPILRVKDHQYIATGNSKCSAVLEQDDFSDEELLHYFGMVFPTSRAKHYIEIRTGDSLPYPLNFSYIALIKGLFYNEAALDELCRLADTMDEKQLENNMAAMMTDGFKAKFAATTIGGFLPGLFDLARAGLPAEEKHYLQPLEKLLLAQKNAALLGKEKLLHEGLNGLKQWTLNHWIVEDHFDVDKDSF